MRHWNNGTDHRHSKSCCDKSSPARRTITCVHTCAVAERRRSGSKIGSATNGSNTQFSASASKPRAPNHIRPKEMADPPASAPRMCEHTRGNGAGMSKSARLPSATAPRIYERSLIRWNLRVPDIQTSCTYLTIWQGTRMVTPVVAVGRHALLMINTCYVVTGSNIDRCPYIHALTAGHIIGLARDGIVRDTWY